MTNTLDDALRERLRSLVTPARTDVMRAKRAVLAAFDDGQAHYAATLLDTVSDALGSVRNIDRVQVDFLQSPDPARIEPTTPAVAFLRTRLAGLFAVAELAAGSIIVPAVPPPTTGENTHIQWLYDTALRIGIHHPGGGFGVDVSIPRPALDTAYLHPSDGERWYRDPDLFLEDLSSLGLDERAQRALRESLHAYGRGLYLAAASLLGVVTEAAWYAAAERLGKPGRLEEEIRNERTAKVQTLVAGLLRDRKAGGPTMSDELLANAALLRELRNYGVHPVKVRDDLERYFDEEECGLLLLRTHNYLVRLTGAVEVARIRE